MVDTITKANTITQASNKTRVNTITWAYTPYPHHHNIPRYRTNAFFKIVINNQIIIIKNIFIVTITTRSNSDVCKLRIDFETMVLAAPFSVRCFLIQIMVMIMRIRLPSQWASCNIKMTDIDYDYYEDKTEDVSLLSILWTFLCHDNKENDDFDDDENSNFNVFQISATSALADGIKTGDCLTDTLSVSNPGGSSPPGDSTIPVPIPQHPVPHHHHDNIPVICGTNTGQHMFVPASSLCNDVNINVDTGSTVLTRWHHWVIKVVSSKMGFHCSQMCRQWQIKVTQFECGSEVGRASFCDANLFMHLVSY